MPTKTNLTQKDFAFVYQVVLHDSKLCAFDRGMLITIINLPNDWTFSVNGLCSILPDGKSAISCSLRRLEESGYIRITKGRNEKGLFETTLELCIPSETSDTKPCTIIGDGQTVTDNPSPSIHPRLSATDKQPQYKTNRKTDIKQHNNPSVLLSLPAENGTKDRTITEEEEQTAYRKLIAENIRLDWLLDAAKRSEDSDEIAMVNEIYALICDYVCFPRGNIKIRDTVYPWQIVKAQFLKLRHSHVASVLNRVVDRSLGIKNMQQYLIAMLYSESLCGTIKSQADLHDDYLMSLRGSPYAI
ncbi:MAG: hypothetical protein J6Y10_02425 [Lachnospiraceae bacterium]|nr:hypothetical protein [Lachnospiraceae bacterium]